MGDRAQVMVCDGDNNEGVWFCTHWRGSDLPETVARGVQRALAANRMDDTEYAARIIFCEMVRGEDPDATTGYGIGTGAHSDTQHPLIVVRCGREPTVQIQEITVPASEFVRSRL